MRMRSGPEFPKKRKVKPKNTKKTQETGSRKGKEKPLGELLLLTKQYAIQKLILNKLEAIHDELKKQNDDKDERKKYVDSLMQFGTGLMNQGDKILQDIRQDKDSFKPFRMEKRTYDSEKEEEKESELEMQCEIELPVTDKEGSETKEQDNRFERVAVD